MLEGVGTSPEVNALRSRIRREIADLIRDLWAEYDPEAANGPHGAAISVGVFGILFESMVHLAETNRLNDAPEHVPALVTAVDRVLTPEPVTLKLGIVTPVLTLLAARACAVGRGRGVRRRRRRRAGSRTARLSPLHVQ